MLMFHPPNLYHNTKESFCVIQFQFFYMPISTHYNIQSIRGTQWKRESARYKHSPKTCNFHGENVYNTQTNKKLPIPTLTQINVWNIGKAAIFIRQMGMKFAVMKPSVWMICQATYVINMTAWKKLKTWGIVNDAQRYLLHQ